MSRSRKRLSVEKNDVVHLAWRASSWGIISIIVFSIFLNLLRFVTPLYIIHVFDRVPASRSVETLVLLTMMALLAIITGVALDVVRKRMLGLWGKWIEEQFGQFFVYRGLSEKSVSQPRSVQELLDELYRLRSFIARSAVRWIDVIWAPLFVWGVYLISPLLGSITLAAMFLVIALGLLQESATREPRRASRKAAAEAGDIVLNAERKYETISAFSMASNISTRWRQTTAAHLHERERAEARYTFYRLTMRGLGECLRIGLIGVGVWLFLQGSLTLGAVFAARILGGYGYRYVERAVGSWRSLKDGMAAYRSLKAQLEIDHDNSVSIHSATSSSALVIDQLSFRYPGQTSYVLRRLSLTLNPGELLVITGGAGSGKTTLSRLAVGLLEPRYGQVRLGDVEVRRLPPDVQMRMIGYLPQHTELFRGTVRENIACMGDADFDNIVRAAKLASIHEVLVGLPQGYDTLIGEETITLSGSEQKRIALARAIYRRPRLLVLDEPAANLDRRSRNAMEAAVSELKAAGSSIIVTQATKSSRWNAMADKFLILGGRTAELSVAPSKGSPKVSELRRVK
ncbi:type I secretion system permease/ATPase [Microvirga arsenatis]|uniref:ATP-binding cassette domain-containing protein n=1 Tax=Microvirga arsenatis TaxID=2692265 RepID=A0ABW9YS47_9HYPH|nr:ATP-binding cassette domain-containing protein [Microvirga arsenatis]NBJ10056.1 ATP-binding cassette domain-containing protein [Microvirga arsenatis]NBJ23124.1 ATP-binding cassette domain-containing protein [Microvirga arsenatis]